jgi:hypothetical protein
MPDDAPERSCRGLSHHLVLVKEERAGDAHQTPLQEGLEKTRVFKRKKNQPSGFFWFFLYICPEERIFRGFPVSKILLGAFRR